MNLSRRVKLGATQMDSLDTSIVIQDVQIGTPTETISKAALAGGAGSRILNRHWDTLDVEVRFGILLPKTDITDRRAVWDKVAAWAIAGGWLRSNEVPERRLWIDQAEMEDPGDFREWNKDFGITFHAITVPFWQSDTPTETTKTGIQNTSFDLTVTGQAQTVADLEFTNTSGSTMTWYTIGTNEATIMLEGLSIANNKKIVIDHYNGRIRIRDGDGNSLMHLRTGVSGDDLYLNPGTESIRQLSGGSGNLKLSFSGRWL